MTFEQESLPVVEYLETFGKVRTVDATCTIDQVWSVTQKYFQTIE